MAGGKGVEETITCLEHLFRMRKIGAEKAIVNCDGAIPCYKLLMYFAFICHPKSPNRCFKSVWNTSPETSHSRLNADTISGQMIKLYKRVKHVNENSKV